MVVELRAKSQITIPSNIVKTMGLEEGDQFEVVEKDGGVLLIPVVTYPKAYVEHLEEEFKKATTEAANGTRPIFDSAKTMTDYLETH